MSYVRQSEAYLVEGEWFRQARNETLPERRVVEATLSRDEHRDHVEYDADQQDLAYLQLINYMREKEGKKEVSMDVFEICMDSIEKWMDGTYHYPRGGPEAEQRTGDEGECAVCGETEGEDSNMIVFCDGCDLAVHQECYGIPHVPEGQWLCSRCSEGASEDETRCVLCPNKGGAFKRTVNAGEWAHLRCALWIPETGVLDPVQMEPVDGIAHIPKSRWALKCIFCKTREGAAIQCHEPSCTTAFHVTCAQKAGVELPMKALPAGVEGTTEEAAETTSFPMKAYCFRHEPAAIQARRETRQQQREAKSAQQQQQQPDAEASRRHAAQQSRDEQLPPRTSVPAHVFARLRGRLEARLGTDDMSDVLQALCRYWALKREARRGAPINRRLASAPPRQMPAKTDEYQMRYALLSKSFSQADALSRRIQALVDVARDGAQAASLIRGVVSRAVAPLPEVCESLLARAKALDEPFGLFSRRLPGRALPIDLLTVEARYAQHPSIAFLLKDLHSMYTAVQQAFAYDSVFFKEAVSQQHLLDIHLNETLARLPDAPREPYMAYHELLLNGLALEDIAPVWRKFAPELFSLEGPPDGDPAGDALFPDEFVPPTNVLPPAPRRAARLARDPLSGFRPVLVDLENKPRKRESVGYLVPATAVYKKKKRVE